MVDTKVGVPVVCLKNLKYSRHKRRQAKGTKQNVGREKEGVERKKPNLYFPKKSFGYITKTFVNLNFFYKKKIKTFLLRLFL